MNRIIMALAAASFLLTSSGSVSAQGRPDDFCTPTSPPVDPSLKDTNPGAGGRLGLNEDFHEDGHPYFGENLSDFQVAWAQDDIAGNETLIAHTVGNDCHNFDFGD
jgi:hypothetical protein